MKRLVFVVLLIVTYFIADAQVKVTGCGYIVPPRTIRTNFQSVYEAKQILQRMLDTIKWKENFSMREQNGIRNAYATIINKIRWIIYDNNFLEDIDSYAATKWASISILAHEMGHHYYNHMVSGTGSTPPKEIEADALSGYVMQKLGATLNESIAAISAIASDRASATHPAKKDRVAAISRGWNSAKNEATNGGNTGGGNTGTGGTGGNTGAGNTGGGNTGTGGNTGGGNTGGQGNTNLPPADDPSWINLTIQSNKDEQVWLSDDGKNYQAAPIKAGEAFVFRFEIYQYGWLKLPYYNGFRVYKLMHGKDYSILWNRRTRNWTVVEVPN